MANIVSEFSYDLAVQTNSHIYHTYSYEQSNFYGTVFINTDQFAIESLLNDVRVDHIIADTEVNMSTTQFSPPWGLDRIDQINLPLNNQYTYSNNGSAVNVFVIDTGIKTSHNEFIGRNVDEENFSIPCPPPICVGHLCNFPIMSMGDQVGHGTHVAATVGGTTYGVAKSIKLHSIKIFSQSCPIPESVIIDALHSLNNRIANNPSLLPAVVNMSYGGGTQNSESKDLYQQLTNKGVILVAAAGNKNSSNCSYPANYNDVISVGASTINDARASFSNKGSCIDLFAPGEDILSAGIGSNSSWAIKNGTSMATPHVSGAVALYLQDHPSASVNQVKSALLTSASNIALSNAGAGSPSKLLNSSQLSPILIIEDEYDNVPNQRAYDDDVRERPVLWPGGTTYQTHNFHDSGDTDWTIVYAGGNNLRFRTELIGAGADTKMSVYKWTGGQAHPSGNGTFINITDQFMGSDSSVGSSEVIINDSASPSTYAVKIQSRINTFGTNTEYKLLIDNLPPTVSTPDQYDNVPSQRAYDDDVRERPVLWPGGTTYQTHNFHDSGDTDWTIVYAGGNNLRFRTELIGAGADTKMSVYKWTGGQAHPSGNGTFINITDQFMGADSSVGSSEVIINDSASPSTYAVKIQSRTNTFGSNTEYKLLIDNLPQ